MSSDLIDEIIKLSQNRNGVTFIHVNGGTTTLRRPLQNLANTAIAGVANTGEFTLVLLSTVATVTFPGPPPSGFNDPINYPKDGSYT